MYSLAKAVDRRQYEQQRLAAAQPAETVRELMESAGVSEEDARKLLADAQTVW